MKNIKRKCKKEKNEMIKEMQILSREEMEKIEGGFCSLSYGGHLFCCPLSEESMMKKIEKYSKIDKDKASQYVQFCYEKCGYRG